MPETSHEGLTDADRARLSNYTPGYDWLPGRFGPPPGILRARKEQLDRMSDRDYMAAVLRMGQEEKESLMISEAERLRTYKSLWPNPPCVSYKDLAREGFYYTGMSDRVQCAFCAGFLGNWAPGDVPSQSHRQFFSYCKMAQKKPCANIPLSHDLLPDDVQMAIVSTRRGPGSDRNRPPSFFELGINRENPYHPRYRIYSTRLGTYRGYSSLYPMTPEILSEAGFFYEGPSDKVRCFWCDGALELWSEGDDAWVEHAKWYPGCGFLQQTKGRDFIRQSRSQMSEEDLSTAENLQYQSNDLRFLTDDTEAENRSSSQNIVSRYDSYKVCKGLGFADAELEMAFRHNGDMDFSNVQALIGVLLSLRNNDLAQLEHILRNEQRNSQDAIPEEDVENLASMDLSPSTRFLDVDRICIKGMSEELDEDDNKLLLGAMTCSQCAKETIGAVILPCGHFILCHHCSTKRLPERCLVCNKAVKGSCRTYLC